MHRVRGLVGYCVHTYKAIDDSEFESDSRHHIFNERVNTVTQHAQTYMNPAKMCEIILVSKVNYSPIVHFTTICICMLLRDQKVCYN